MEALEFFKARKRMCEATNCNGCKLYHAQVGCCITPQYEKIEAFEEAIAIVEQWAKDHPIKTRQSEFLKHYPEAKLRQDGVLTICPLEISPAYRDKDGSCVSRFDTCAGCKRKFWLAEVEL